MAISYNKLWHLLIEKGMNKEQLKKASGISSATMTKISKGESVTLKTIGALCEVLNCQPGDILSYENHLENSKKTLENSWQPS